ncbi:MAG: SRPBCC family protein [Acidobacteriota bacterium]
MIEVSAEQEIDASADAVWNVLTDLDHFGEWNPFIREAHGKTNVGGEVRVRVKPSLHVPLVFHASVTASQPGRELRWHGEVLSRWIARGDHVFAIEPLGEHRVRFVQRERFTGILPWLAGKLVAREARRGFAAMNRALDRRVHELEAGA